MRGYYQFLDVIKSYLESHIQVSTVKVGNINEIDLKKQTIYPLAQIVMGDVSFDDNVMNFDAQVVVMDAVTETGTDKDEYGKVDNKVDVLNTMLTVLNGLQTELTRGSLYKNNFQISGTPVATPFEDNYGNLLTGWSLQFSVTIPNNEIGLCDFQLDFDLSGSLPEDKYMLKSIYDNNGNNIVDNTEKLGGHLPSYFQISGSYLSELPDGLVSGSSQIDHDQTTNFTQDEHFVQGDILITESQISDLTHTVIPDGTISGSSQLDGTTINNLTGSFSGSFYGDGSNLTGVTSYTDEDTRNVLKTDNVISGSSQVTIGDTTGQLDASRIDNLPPSSTPDGTVSGSSQIDHDQTTNFVENEHIDWSVSQSLQIDPNNYLTGSDVTLPDGLVSGSSQIVIGDTTGQLNASRIDGLTSGSVTEVTGVYPIEATGSSVVSISLVDSTVTPGSYNFANVTVDSKGIITDIETGQDPTGSLDLTNVAYTNVTNVFTKYQTVANELYISSSTNDSASIEVITSGSTVFEVQPDGDVVSSGSYYGDGSHLTGIPAGYTDQDNLDYMNSISVCSGSCSGGGGSGDNVAYTDISNEFIVGQTIGGNLDISSSLATDSYVKFYDGNTVVFEVTASGDVHAQSYYGDGSHLTGIITSSYQDSDVKDVLNTENVLSGSQQVIDSLPSGSVSSSLQVDHNNTTNYSSSRHFLQEDISITESQVSDLQHFTDSDVKDKLNVEGVVSGSSQIDHNTTTNYTSSEHYTQDQISITESQISDLDHYTNDDLPSGTISGSEQVDFDGISNKPTLVSGSEQVDFDLISNKPTLVSGSEQVSFDGIVDKPTLVSGSSQIDHNLTTNYSSSRHFEQVDIAITSSQVTDIQDTITNNSAVVLNTDKITNSNHTGDVVGSGSLTIQPDTVTYDKMQDMTIQGILGKYNVGTGTIEQLSVLPSNVEDNISITESQISDLTHYTDQDNLDYMNSIEVVSGSVLTQLPNGLISGSIQVDHDSTTNFTQDEHFTQAQIAIPNSSITDFNLGVRGIMDTDNVISGSEQIDASLVSIGVFRSSVIPAIAITDTYTAINEVEQLSFEFIEQGDVVVRSDENKSYINLAGNNNTMGDWQELLTPTDAVTSVNGQTGVVVLDTGDIAEGSNLYFTDTRVTNNSSVLANTAKVGITTEQADDIIDNNNKVGYTDELVKTKLDVENVLSGSFTGQLPDGTISGSSQIDHNLTTNYSASRHFEQSDISITESQISDLDHYTDGDNLSYMNSIEVVSGSVLTQLPSGTVSGSSQIVIGDTTGLLDSSRLTGEITASAVDYDNIVNKPTLVSGSSQIVISDTTGQLDASRIDGIPELPSGVVSGSSQIDHDQTTNYTSDEHFTQDQISITESQISDLDHYTTDDLPNGTVSESIQVILDETTGYVAGEHFLQGDIVIQESQIWDLQHTVIPDGTISGSEQVILDETTGYVAGEHFLQGDIVITESQISDLTHYTDSDNQDYLDTIGIVTGSIDVDNVAYKNSNNNFTERQYIQDSGSTVLKVSGNTDDLLQVIDDNTGDRFVITDPLLGELIKVDTDGDLYSSGSITADEFIGDGSNLTGLPAGYTDQDTQDFINSQNVHSGSVIPIQDYIQLNVTGSDLHSEGKLEYDEVCKALVYYNDEPDVKLQIGQEMWMRVYNDTASPIENGKVVTVINVNGDGVPHIDLAITDTEDHAKNIVGITTHEIEPSSYGYVTTNGFVNEVDTSGLTLGTIVYASHTEPGGLTTVRPPSPYWTVKMGGVAISDSSNGRVHVDMVFEGNYHDIHKFYNGTILESHTVHISSDGTIVTLVLLNTEGGPRLNLIFDQEFVSINTGSTINLTTGTDTTPVRNYVYIPKSTSVLTVSTSGWPSNEEYVAVADVIVPTAALAHSEGVYKQHSWTDHLSNSVGQGHLSGINKWIRNRPTAWISGNVVSFDVLPDVQSASINLSYTEGKIFQLHEHVTPDWNTTTGDPIFVINDSVTAYKQISNLNSVDLDSDSLGGSFGNGYWVGVIWGVGSEDFVDSHLFLNLPKQGYTKLADALIDLDNSADYTIPHEYTGTGFLLTKIVFKKTANDIEYVTDGVTDLRGLVPSTASGGGTIGGSGVSNWVDLGDTPGHYTDNGNKPVVGNIGESGLIFNEIGTAPASSSSSGNAGEVIYTTDYVYVCVATDTWKRSPLTTW